MDANIIIIIFGATIFGLCIYILALHSLINTLRDAIAMLIFNRDELLELIEEE